MAEKSFNPDDQPSCYVDAFMREVKRLEDAGKPIGEIEHLHKLMIRLQETSTHDSCLPPHQPSGEQVSFDQ